MFYFKKFFLITLLAVTASAISSYSQAELEITTIEINNISLTVEVAADPKSRQKGLMHRESLAGSTGMLFVYPKEIKINLWMKNTFMPLSAAFIKEDGKIVEIISMEKIDSAKIYGSEEKVKYTLEVPLGWFEEMGVKTGDYCAMPNIPSK